MTVLWPAALLLLMLIPLLVAAYLWMLRRRRRYAVRFSSLSLIRAAMPRPSRLRRHGPFALLLLGLASLVLALARPVSIVSVPTGQGGIILAIDVSRSMCATDIPPSRLEAAKAAALQFIEEQPQGLPIGIVAFAGFAQLVQEPTTDQEALRAAIDSLIAGRGTAIGEGIIVSLDAIAAVNDTVTPVDTTLPAMPTEPRPEGAYTPEVIVLLTDGVSRRGIAPQAAAAYAAERGVRIYTIGFGTPNGNSAGSDCGMTGPYDGRDFGGGWGGGGGGNFWRGIDEAALQQVADTTGGGAYNASSAGELQQVFADLPITFAMRDQQTEISVIFAALGALLAVVAVGLSLWWHPLP